MNFLLVITASLVLKKYAVFCDSIKTELETIDVKSLGEDDQISHELLHFKLKETSVKYNFKTHWNPILSDAGFHSSLTYRVRPITSKKNSIKIFIPLESNSNLHRPTKGINF